jgi:hypothetical protein
MASPSRVIVVSGVSPRRSTNRAATIDVPTEANVITAVRHDQVSSPAARSISARPTIAAMPSRLVADSR